jgi:hypothetical protein
MRFFSCQLLSLNVLSISYLTSSLLTSFSGAMEREDGEEVFKGPRWLSFYKALSPPDNTLIKNKIKIPQSLKDTFRALREVTRSFVDVSSCPQKTFRNISKNYHSL